MFKLFDSNNDIFTSQQKIFTNINFSEITAVIAYQPSEAECLGIIISNSGTDQAFMAIEYGQTEISTFSGAFNSNYKQAIYNKYVQLIQPPDSVFSLPDKQINEAFFINLNRVYKKDQLRRNVTDFQFYYAKASVSGSLTSFKDEREKYFRNLNDEGNYLNISGSVNSVVGLIYYNAGLIVLDADKIVDGGIGASGSSAEWDLLSGLTLYDILSETGTNYMSELFDGFMERLENYTTQNQQTLFLNDFYCRAYPDEFNYSSNPTYIDDDGDIRLFTGTNFEDKPDALTFITTVGLYDSFGNLVAVAKLNKPIKKNFSTERTVKVRLTY